MSVVLGYTGEVAATITRINSAIRRAIVYSIIYVS
jgi:hypothetical protein